MLFLLAISIDNDCKKIIDLFNEIPVAEEQLKKSLVHCFT